jgi:tetratricopeptide (TPR) repeat protein
MGCVFISYRRADIPYALLVYNHLSAEFGSEQVFRDIEGIAVGEDFVTRIQKALRRSRAVVALIGRGWLRQRSRLSRRDDLVRLELLLALEGGIAVYPILVGGAHMPPAKQLPRALASFARLNAIPVTDYRFPTDLDVLIDAVRRKLGRIQAPAQVEAETGLMTEQVQRLQIQAVELIERSEIARAQRILKEGWNLLMDLSGRTTPDAQFQIQLGYLHKTLAQAFEAAGSRNQADHHMALAASSFSYVQRQAQAGTVTTADLAGALNGLGNVHSYRGESAEAIACYREAVKILPDYAYAWHDLFLELLNLARRGQYQPQAMKEVLDRLRETGLHVQGVGPERIAAFEAELARLETQMARIPAPGRRHRSSR